MITTMKSLHANSEADLAASVLKGHLAVGIITIIENEFRRVLDHFTSRRHVIGKNRLYEYAQVPTKKGSTIGVAITRCPEQGQGSAHAVARDMITDLGVPWILLVGIAGGFPDSDYTLGDVLISSRVHDFAVSAALENGTAEYQQQGGPIHVEVEKLITHLPALEKELGNWNSPASFWGTQALGTSAGSTYRSKILWTRGLAG